MISPENYNFNDTQLQQEILHKAEEVNRYVRTHEGEYVSYKATKMLGRMATAYSHIPVFISGVPLLLPTPDGTGYGMGEITGKISGFTYMNLGGAVEQWKPSNDGVIMHVSVPELGREYPSDATWKLNILPEEMRHEDLEGFLIGVPVTDSQRILQLGEKQEPVSVQSLLTPEQTVKEYSYRDYVERVRALTGNNPSFDMATDAAKSQAFEKLLNNIVYECPYLNSLVVIKADYIRRPKPDGSGYTVAQGTISGILRKFIHDVYQDYQTKEWRSDVMAVVYDAEVAKLVTSGKISPQEADQYPSTNFVPLSKPHILATETGLKS